VACPFFLPMERLDGEWLYPHRLPLGCGWRGQCAAPGHEGESPSQEELRDFCNLGYAQGCRRLPQEREWDSLRFGVKTPGNGVGIPGRIQIHYVCERDHRPAENGTLIFDTAGERWECIHGNPCVQKMAECFLQSFIEKKKREAERAAS